MNPGSIVLKTKESDVILGRGNHVNYRPGNVAFRGFAAERAIEYTSSVCKQEKNDLARQVVLRAKESGARFLRSITVVDSKGDHMAAWEIVGDETILVKAKQAMRDTCTSLKKTSNPPQSQELLPTKATTPNDEFSSLFHGAAKDTQMLAGQLLSTSMWPGNSLVGLVREWPFFQFCSEDQRLQFDPPPVGMVATSFSQLQLAQLAQLQRALPSPSYSSHNPLLYASTLPPPLVNTCSGITMNGDGAQGPASNNLIDRQLMLATFGSKVPVADVATGKRTAVSAGHHTTGEDHQEKRSKNRCLGDEGDDGAATEATLLLNLQGTSRLN